MGLDTTHNAWHGPYTAFGAMRKSIAKAVGFNLNDKWGFGGVDLFDKSDPITYLLDHSDCDGEIEIEHLKPLALRLEEIAPLIEDAEHREWALQFAKGCWTAHVAEEPIVFR